MRSDADRNFSLTPPPEPDMLPGLAGREVPILRRMRGLR
jgi:hypothetical protein